MSARGRGPRPSERWLRLVERLAPDGEGPLLRVELEHLYDARVAKEGRAAADRWLRREALAFVAAAAGRELASLAAGARGLGGDVARALRALLRAPAFAATVVLTLGLGIGATALVFSLVDRVLIRPLPFDEPDRLVAVWDGLSRGELAHVRGRTRTLSELRGWFDGGAGVNLEIDGEAHRLPTSFVEPGLFDLLGARPLVGRLFAPDESQPGQNHVAILGEGLWRSLFGADPNILDRSITLDGRPYRVVGVLPSGWRFPDPADRLWLPMEWNRANLGLFWGAGGLGVVGRLADDATPGSAQRELRSFSPELSAENPIWTPDPGYRADSTVKPLRDVLVADARGTLLVLLGAVSAVLLVVCANVSSLLVARSIERGPSVAVRTALGASRARVAREALAESFVLGLIGAALGVLLAIGGLDLLRPALVGRLPRADELGIDLTVLVVAVGAGLAAGLAAGVAPALRAARRDPAETLRSGARGASPGRGRRRASRALVGAQVGAAIVLLTCATLLARTLAALGGVDPGFSPQGLVTADVTFPSTWPEDEAAAAYDALIERTRALPGVEQASLAASLPFGALRETFATFIEDVTTDPNDLPTIDVDRVETGWFETLGIPLLEGRTFTDADQADTPLVAVVDELMAREYWPGTSAVGRRIRYPWAGAPWIEIVGVVGSVADDDLTAARRPRWYVPLAQRPAPNVTLVARVAHPTSAFASALSAAVADVDRRLPVSNVAPYAELLGEASARTRITARVLLAFALVTLVLGCLGVHGVGAHLVRERRREIGMRMALGAGAERIRWDIVREGLVVAGPAALVGTLLAAAATRALGWMLYGVDPLDPLTFVAVPVGTVLAAVAAMWLPARRAARLDPVEALRQG